MKTHLLYGAVRALTSALVLGACLPASATPVMEMQIENLLPMAPDFRNALHLNPNQQILWQQVESKSQAIVRERQSRRGRLQAALKTALGETRVELRELGAGLDAEAATSAAEEKQLRELWLGMNDALDENQRRLVLNLFAEQLMRVPDSGSEHAAPHPREQGSGQHRGTGRGKGGGIGMPGG